MLRYLVYRIILLLPVLFGISVVVFLLIQLIPSDVVDMLLGMNKTPEAAAAMRRMFGLDQPVVVQYARWMGGVLRGDLGYSLRTGQPVGYLVSSRFVVSAELAGLGLLLAVVVGIPFGVLAALNHNKTADHVATSTALIGLSIPDFWLGTLLILLLSVKARWLPPSGYVPLTEDPVQNLLLMLMPAITLAGGSASYIMRITRAVVLEVLSEDYVRTAWAKGLPWLLVVVRHTLRNALAPVLAVIGIQMGYLLGGVVVVESIFAIPGLGRTALESIYARDYPVVMAVVLLIATLYVLINLVVDLLTALVDPRIASRTVRT